MNEDQGFSTTLKIVIIASLLVLVVVAVLIYSRNLDQQSNGISSESLPITEKIVDNEKLISTYQSSLLTALDSFNGNYQDLQESILNIAVPSGYQELHLRLVLALNPIIYEDSPNITKTRLQAIVEKNVWLETGLDKIILNIK